MAVSQYIVLQVGTEHYGAKVQHVVSIDQAPHITPIPNAFRFLKGVSRIRGVLTHIVDLRERLGHEVVPDSEQDQHVVVIETQGLTIGLTVDGVDEVIDIDDDSISPIPDFARGTQSGFLHGVATLDGKLLILLNLEHILSELELLQLHEVESQVEQ